MEQRPLGFTDLSSKLGMVLHFDFLYLDTYAYIFRLIDGLSRKVLLKPNTTLTATATLDFKRDSYSRLTEVAILLTVPSRLFMSDVSSEEVLRLRTFTICSVYLQLPVEVL